MSVPKRQPTNCRYVQYIETKIPSSGFDLHYHEFYELYYFVEGDADYLVEGKQYHLTPHSLLLLSPYVFHGVRVNSSIPYKRYFVYFTPDIFPMELQSLLLSAFPGEQNNSQKEVFYEQTKNYELTTYLDHLTASNNQPSLERAQYFTVFLQALLGQISIMSQTLHPSPVTRNVSKPILDILTYLNEHLTENISLDDLSRRFFLSKYYMNRSFRKATGTTVMDYLTYKRIIKARQLIYNGYSATDASLLSGFNDYSVFYRDYKKVLGCSPRHDKPIT
ncbi:MAG: helix-turn-helix domain-containing protein [Lachnospiraceae bacterium]|nr:helix-turn-helix domain-containing protein [Lachnospiraceae bacterium]